jgi:hypothetical protein
MQFLADSFQNSQSLLRKRLGGLSVSRFCEAVRAEGFAAHPGVNIPLHTHPVFNTADVYGHGKPTRIANAARDVRQPIGSLPITESIPARTYNIPWFKHCRKPAIDQYVAAIRKVAGAASQLLAGGRFAATLAVYQLTKQNIMIGDPTDPTHNRVLIIGAIQARGIELQASGSPAPGLGMVVSYSYTDSKTSKGNETFPVGIITPNLPRNRFSFWSTYTVRSGTVRGAELGAGLTVADDQFANGGQPFRLPGYTILDALLAYHGRAFGIQLNFTNLTDAQSYQGISYSQVAPSAPRSAVTTISYQF